MDERTQTAYLNLIKQLLISPLEQVEEILDANCNLIDETLVKIMAAVADQLLDRNEIAKAEFLISLAEQLATSLQLPIHEAEEIGNPEVSSSDQPPPECVNFLTELLQAMLDRPNDRDNIYRLLADNVDKLDRELVRLLRLQETALFPNVEREQAVAIAAAMNGFSVYLSDFPLGSKAWSLEIAITGYEVSLVVLTSEAFLEYWTDTQINLGNAYSDRIFGNRSENQNRAIQHYQAALQVHTREVSATAWAMIQNNLGIIYQQQVQGEPAENLELAIDAYQNALKIYTSDTFPQDWAMAQNNLGEAYRNRIHGERAENLEQAIACYYAALQVRKREAFPDRWAATQDNLGIAYTQRLRGERVENLQLAIAAFEQVLQVRTHTAFPQEWAITQNNLGIAYRESGQPANAIAAYQNSLQVRTREALPVLWAQTQNNLGNAHLDLKQFSEAIACYRAALSVRTLAAAPAECLMTAKNLGHAALLSERWSEAIEGYRLAVEAVESIRGWALTDRRRQEIQVAAMDAYAGAIQAYIKADRPDLSMEYAERSKAQNLVERLANRTLYPTGNISPIVLQEFDRLRQEISREQLRIDMAEWHNTSYENRSHFYELRRQLDELLNEQIEPHDPDFSLTQRIEPISFTEIQALLGDRHTALIEWYVLGEIFVAFIVTFDKSFPTVWQSSIEDKQALAQWTEEYLNTYYLQKTFWQSQLPVFLARLAAILHWQDILACIPSSCNQFILIPHRGLHLFPLHALPVETKQQPNNSEKRFEPVRLIDYFPAGVRYAPSCQILQQAQARQRRCFDHLFAIQNPTDDLDYTNVEVETIQRYFQTSKLLVKSAARKDAIEDEQFQVAHCVHFSCHGYFNADQPLRSALLLADCYIASAPTNSDPADYLLLSDGRAIVLNQCLTLDGILAQDLSQCRLVSLSACETGLTDSTALSDEYIGWPSGFLVAGSASVVSSLWTVNDLSTTFLMIKFYQNLQAVHSVAVALNQAQLWLRDITKAELKAWMTANSLPLDPVMRQNLNKRLHKLQDDQKPFQDPFHWAAFCAIGQ